MKGVNKRVVEINETQNEYIERVLVFLNGNDDEIKVAQEQNEAEKYAGTLVAWKRKLLPYKGIELSLVLSGAMGLIIGIIIGGFLI